MISLAAGVAMTTGLEKLVLSFGRRSDGGLACNRSSRDRGKKMDLREEAKKLQDFLNN